MSLATELWQANQDFAQEILQHPFVQGIADGSLPKACFQYYLSQDAFFLKAFARAYSVTAAKVSDFEDFIQLHDLVTGVLQELQLHRRYATNWSVDLDLAQVGAAAQHYIDFLLATAWSTEIGVTAVAMAPCMRLYAFLGQQLAQKGIPDHTFRDWIETYSSPDFEQLATKLEQLIDRYAHPGVTARSTYRYAMQCERDFFQAAWLAASH